MIRRLAASLVLSGLAWLPSGPARAVGEGRATAQTIGITDATSSAIPGFVWGGKRRCDPTDSACTHGGRLNGDQQVDRTQPVPAKPFVVSERVLLDLSLSGQPVGSIELGMWRDQAPASVEAFVLLAEGRLAPRPGDAPASLRRSTLVRISKDKAIVLGALREVCCNPVKGFPVPAPFFHPHTAWRDRERGACTEKCDTAGEHAARCSSRTGHACSSA